MRLVISNATPIISLALIGQLQLLEALYGQVLIPNAVREEVMAGGDKVGSHELAHALYIKSVSVTNVKCDDSLNDLDQGEAEVIVLAQEQKADLVIIDELLGRRHAKRLGLSVTGTIGVLLRAKQEGHLERLAPYLDQLQRAGIHLSTRLIEQAIYLAGEE